MCIATAPAYSFKLRRSDISAIPRHHAAPMGLAVVLEKSKMSTANCNLGDAAIVSLLETVLYNNRQE